MTHPPAEKTEQGRVGRKQGRTTEWDYGTSRLYEINGVTELLRLTRNVK